MTCMGGELRLKARARERRAMARPSETLKNKRKEVEVEVEKLQEEPNRAGGSEKRSKLNAERGDHSHSQFHPQPHSQSHPQSHSLYHGHNHSCEHDDGYGRGQEHGYGSAHEVSRNGSLVQIVGRILERRRRKRSRPLPALMGDKAVDLVALHSKVQSMGGYSKVTEGKMWGAVSEALELGAECGPGLKLVFVKYLKALDAEERYGRRSTRFDASLPSSSELRTQSGRRELWHRERKEDGGSGSDGMVSDDGEDGGGHEEMVMIGDDLRSRHRRRSQLECRQSSTSQDWAPTYASGEHLSASPGGEGRREHARGSDEGPGASDDWYEGGREENVTLQRGALNGMMEWIKRVAVCPADSSAGLGAPGSGQDEDWVSQCQMVTASVRSLLWKEPRGGDSSIQVRPLPAAYYDESVRLDPQALERLRVTRERLAQFGFQPPPGPRSSRQDNRNVDGSAYWGTPGAYAGQRSGRQPVNYNEAALARAIPQRKRIPIGPDFQADEVPWVPREHVHRSEESGGEGSSGSDDDDDDEEDDDDESRWLGVRVWPQRGVDSSLSVRVGRGRPPSCDCPEAGSIDCVRAHCDAARARLRMELGQAWFEMGFDQVGESVANYWTKEEERAFRLVARTHPVSKNSNFWDHLPGAFPYKTRRELNSYYFNVFMLRRRALQNRLRESNIDSDDDEGELPGESDDSEYDDSDDDEEEEDEDEEEEDEDPASDDTPGVMYPLKTPIDSTREPKYRLLPDFNFGSTEPEVARIDRAQIEAVGHVTGHADDSHVVLVWDDKELESGSLVRDGVLSQEWQEHNWDVREHHQEAVPSTRHLSPPIGKDADVRRAPALGDLWSQGMEMAPKREKDRLLSTNGMIFELFGDDGSD